MQFQLVPPKTWFLHEDKLYLRTAHGPTISFSDERLGATAYFSATCEVIPVPCLFAYPKNERLIYNFRTEEGAVIEYNPSRRVRFGDLPIGKYFSHSAPTSATRDIFLKISNEGRGSFPTSYIVSDVAVLDGRGSISVYMTNQEDMVYVCSPPC